MRIWPVGVVVAVLSGCAHIDVQRQLDDVCSRASESLHGLQSDDPAKVDARAQRAQSLERVSVLVDRKGPKRALAAASSAPAAPVPGPAELSHANVARGMQALRVLASGSGAGASNEVLILRSKQAVDGGKVADWARALGYGEVDDPTPTAKAMEHLPAAVAAARDLRTSHASSDPLFVATSEETVATVSRDDADRTRRIQKIAQAGGFDAAAAYSLVALLEADGEAALRQADEDFTTTAFLALYLKRYFHGGRVLQVKLESADILEKLKGQLDDSLKGVPDYDKVKDRVHGALDAAAKKPLGDLCRDNTTGNDCMLTRPIGTEGFVTRAGMKVSFQGISVDIGKDGTAKAAVTHPEATEVGPELARVITEAVFDSMGVKVPAAADSTACKANVLPCVTDSEKADVERMDGYATRAEATVSAAAGQVFRAGGPVALNNEALAKSLETLAGVTARKVLEKAAWPLMGTCKKPMAPVWVSTKQ